MEDVSNVPLVSSEDIRPDVFMTPYVSPLRYPGGKLKVVDYIKRLFEVNDLVDGTYIEAYAGGASVALSLLFEKYAGRSIE